MQQTLTKMLDQWVRLKARGGRPEEIVGGLIRYAILFVKYDRRVSGRARRPDVFDFRSGFRQQLLNAQGDASPSDRSAANGWIDWRVASGDDPAEVVMALETTGLSLADYYAA